MRARVSQRPTRGFILPLSVLLVLILALSGMSFMHHDYLERRMASNNTDNHAAFYLANAGIERARATMKIGTDPNGLTWTPTLQPVGPASIDTNFSDPMHQLLCGREPCVIPPFGLMVSSPDFPFDGTFSRGQYAVRAYDNFETAEGDEESEQNPSVDTDQRLTLRAVSMVGNEQKLLEATIFAVSGLKMVNCDERFDSNATPGNPNDDCPTSENVLIPSPLPGREPGSFPPEELPSIQPGFYNNINSFPSSWSLAARTINAPGGTVEFKPGHSPPLEDNAFYFINAQEVILRDSATNLVLFTTGRLTIRSFVSSRSGSNRGAILVAQGGIAVESGAVNIEAPLPFPALVSENGITMHGGATIDGNIWSSGPININANTLRGITVGVSGPITLNVLTVTDHDNSDPSLDYYEPMPGFIYPQGQSGNGIVAGSWQEIQ